MVGSSKILTVSYGTFSCTLEGFDDSFSTMKAIAEYFRDLAADDRCFGAEPPTPDADMLARIAQREISRHVEARTSDKGIVLRAASIADSAPTIQPAVTDAPAVDPTEVADSQVAMPPMPARPAKAATVVETVAAENNAADDEARNADDSLTFDDMDISSINRASTHPDAESVAAKLQRIRAAVGKSAAPAIVDDFSEDLGEDADSTVAQSFDAEETLEDHDVESADQEGDVAFAIMADEQDLTYEEDANVSDAQLDDTVAHADDTGPVLDEAAELDDADAAQTEATFKTADAEADVTEAIVDLDDTDFDESGFEDADVDQDDEQSDLDEGFDATDFAARMAARYGVSQSAETETAVVADETATDDEPILATNATDDDEAEAAQPLRARIVRLKRHQIATSEADEPVADEAMSDADAFADAEASVGADLADAEYEETETDEADLDAFELDDDDNFSIAADDGSDDIAEFDDVPVGSLSPEDEAELQEELAAVEREVAETRAASRGRNILPETDDAAMSRILSQTDAELNEPEGNRRRNPIAQLRAAVAATEAARQLGDTKNEAAEAENAFRADLDEAVKPLRPARVQADTTRSERPRPALLKLVASQRVDAPKPDADAAPVAPRRVARTTEPAVHKDATSFAEFAMEMGATELPDLLEAAAAYTAFVEGQEDFSRPQIMDKVKASIDTDISREDGLRSFGTLLRQGKISKLRDGRFGVTDQTRFRPEKRAAQG